MCERCGENMPHPFNVNGVTFCSSRCATRQLGDMLRIVSDRRRIEESWFDDLHDEIARYLSSQ